MDDSSKRIAGTVLCTWFLVEPPLEHPGIGRHTWSWIKACRLSLLPIEQSDTLEVHNAICLHSATHTNPLKRTDSLYLARMFLVCYIIVLWLSRNPSSLLIHPPLSIGHTLSFPRYHIVSINRSFNMFLSLVSAMRTTNPCNWLIRSENRILQFEFWFSYIWMIRWYRF